MSSLMVLDFFEGYLLSLGTPTESASRRSHHWFHLTASLHLGDVGAESALRRASVAEIDSILGTEGKEATASSSPIHSALLTPLRARRSLIRTGRKRTWDAEACLALDP